MADRHRYEGDSFNAVGSHLNNNNMNNRDRDTYSNFNEHENNSNSRRYSVFDMSKSYYSDQGDFNSSRLGIDNSRTVGKNKTAFFKKTGVLIREDEF